MAAVVAIILAAADHRDLKRAFALVNLLQTAAPS
jgi:hypothetical protein